MTQDKRTKSIVSLTLEEVSLVNDYRLLSLGEQRTFVRCLAEHLRGNPIARDPKLRICVEEMEE